MSYKHSECTYIRLDDLFLSPWPWQSGAYDRVPVGQSAPPLPADTAACWSHPGLRAGPHALLGDRRHPDLRLVQPGLRSGSAGRRVHEGAQFDRFVRVDGKV